MHMCLCAYCIYVDVGTRGPTDRAGTGAEWPFNFLPKIEFWALTHIKFQSNSNIAK